MFTVTEHDTKVRKAALKLRQEIAGNHRSREGSLKERILTMSFTEILDERTELLRKLYREGDGNPSVWVTVSQQAVRDSLSEAGISNKGTSSLRRLAREHLRGEFIIDVIRYNVPGGDLNMGPTLPNHRYTSFSLKIDLGAIADLWTPSD